MAGDFQDAVLACLVSRSDFWPTTVTAIVVMNSHSLELLRLAWPTKWETIFERAAPLHVEIGFGSGRFLLANAENRPELNFLGLEIAKPSLDRTERRIQRAGLTNVRLVRGTAQSVLQAACAQASIHGVTINFPDPWPKAAHAQRRLINMSFLELLASRLKRKAYLDIATDHAEYGSWISERLQKSPYFESRLESLYVHEDPDRLRTKYERKGLEAGNTCFYFKWQRNSLPAPDDYALPMELPMPHVVTRSPVTLDEIASRFRPRQCTYDAGTVRLIEMYRSQSRTSLIIDTYISEEPLDQRLMVEIYSRPDRDYLIRLLPTGFPRSTAGVHAAINCVSSWFCELHPEAQVMRHNLRT